MSEETAVKKQANSRPMVKFVGVVLLCVLSFIFLEGVSYIYLRTFDGYDGQHLMNYQFDDYKIILPTPNFSNSKGIYHNAQGFRRRENTSRVKDPSVFRIFVMGGSTAYGLGSLSTFGQEKYKIITNEETIDFYLEEYLKQKFPGRRVEVINAAITSHYSHHHLIYLNQTILKFQPDMVVFIDGFNDYFPYKKDFDQFADYAYQERAHVFMMEPTVNALAGYSGWWLFRKSHFVHLAAKTVRPILVSIFQSKGPRMHIDVKEALANLEDNARRNFLKMVERNGLILKQENVLSVFALQPEMAFKQSKALSPMEQDIFREMDSYWQENFVQFKNEARPMVTKMLQEVTGRTGSKFIDLTDIYGGVEGDVYTDYCHLTPLGNRKLAESLGGAITPLILERMRQAGV